MAGALTEPGSTARGGRGGRGRFGWMIFAVALLIRVAGLVLRHEYVPPGPPEVVGAEAGVIAQHIVDGEGFTSPYDHAVPRSSSVWLAPAYPYFLAGLMKVGLSSRGVFYVAVGFNLLAGALLPWVTWRIGLAMGWGEMV